MPVCASVSASAFVPAVLRYTCRMFTRSGAPGRSGQEPDSRRPRLGGNAGRVGGFRRLAAHLRNTPLHPQWFAFSREDRNLTATCRKLSGLVLDIGCAGGKPRRYLPDDAQYLGLDHYSTATNWYGTRPDVYAEAR